jgi:hypothetical protein
MRSTVKQVCADIQVSKSVYGHSLIDTLYIKNYDTEVVFMDGLWHVCMGHDGKEPMWEPATNQASVADVISTSHTGAAFIQSSDGSHEHIIH